MRSVNYMLDIETLSSGQNALVTSIGAVEFRLDPPFDDEQWNLGRTFKVNVDVNSAQNEGFQISATTVMWWLQQSREAVAAMLERPTPILVRSAFEALANFLTRDRAGTVKPLVWGNGENFDNRVMREGYDLLNMRCPWHYRSDRDMRTFMEIAHRRGIFVEVPRNPLEHDALEDAKVQARRMIAAERQTVGSKVYDTKARCDCHVCNGGPRQDGRCCFIARGGF